MKRRAVTFTAPFVAKAREEIAPTPGRSEALVETIVSAISSGSELLVYRGEAPGDAAVDETIAALGGSFRFPIRYGYAAVGRVVAAGSEVTNGWLGRLVFAFNPHESHFTAPVDALQPLPDGMEPERAIFLPNMETAVGLVMDGRPVIGEQVAVIGQGVVGLLTTALLARLPLAALVTLDGYEARREWSLRLGATVALEPGDLDGARWALQGERDYAGADLTYELSGNPRALDTAVALTGYDGRVVVGSWYGRKRAELDLGGHFHRAHMTLISSQVSRLAPQWLGRWTKARRFDVAREMLRHVRPEQLITHRLPIEQAADAYRLLDEQPGEAIQVIFTY